MGVLLTIYKYVSSSGNKEKAIKGKVKFSCALYRFIWRWIKNMVTMTTAMLLVLLRHVIITMVTDDIAIVGDIRHMSIRWLVSNI